MNEDDARNGLQQFLENNPSSKVGMAKTGDDSHLAVVSPWGEPSIILRITDSNSSALFEALNATHLPERLSAIYHNDTKSLEIFWTAYRLSKNNSEVWKRKFTFRHGGKTYKCAFDKASNRALVIASASMLVGPSDTSYRNLPSFSHYMKEKQNGDEESGNIFGEPASFWIKNIRLSGDELITFISNINFYLNYYDSLSPIAMIHQQKTSKGLPSSHNRYVHKAFPSSIISKTIEPEVLSFWFACQMGGASDKFLYAYRIIEHSAFFHVDQAAKESVRKALMAPHALDDVAATTESVIAAVRSSKIDNYGKFEYVMTHCVSSEVLWEVIEAYITSFSAEVIFDGGFVLLPLVKSANSKEEFFNSGIKTLSSRAKDIRNALSHGREEKSAAVISPTSNNQQKLQAWSVLMARAAGEVIVFQ